MGLQLILGGSGYGKSKRVYSEVLALAKENPHTNYFVVVPDQFTMETQKDLCTQSSVGGIMNIDVLSFKRLSYRVLEEVGKNTIPVLDDTGKSLLLQRVAKSEKDFLPTMGGNIKKTGYIHEVKSVISEFMQYGLDPEKIGELIDICGSNHALQLKIMDLQRMYSAFLAYIDEKYITKEEELVLVKEVIKETKRMQDAVIVFDGFTGFTPVQNQLIQELLKISKDVYVTVLLDEREDPYGEFSEQELFYLSKKMIFSLKNMTKQVGVEKKKDIWLKGNLSDGINYPHGFRYQNKPEFAFLEQNLFRYKKDVYQNETEAIQLVEAISPQDEIRFVCEQICKIIQEEGIRFRDIAVVTGDLNTYAHFVEEIFAKFNIPFFLDLTRGIVLNPLIEYIKSALEIVNKGYTYETVFHFLRSGMLPMEREAIDKLENYVLALGIRGIQKWRNPFYKKSRDFGMHFEEELESINQTRRMFVELMEPFHQKANTVDKKIHILYQFLVDSKFEEALWERADIFERQGEQIKADEYRQIYRLVMDLLNQIVTLLGDELISWSDFSEVLLAGFDEIQVATIPQNRDSVVIGDMKRTRLKETKVLFFVGVNDGIIPGVGGNGGILSDIDREFIDNASFELAPTPRKQMFEQRLYLYMNMTKPTEYLFISYAKTDSEGKARKPSYLVYTIQKLYSKINFIYTKFLPRRERIYASADAMDYFIYRLREYANMRTNAEKEENLELEELISMYRYLKEEFKTVDLDQLVEAAFYEYKENLLGKEIAQALYGKVLENSVSRLEKYASCAYAHFLQYGLQLTEREEYLLEATDTGTVLHGVLEEFSKALEASAYNWFDFPEEFGKEVVGTSLDKFVENYGEDILFDSKRNAYEIIRMKRILERSIFSLQHQVKDGLFKPTDFEVSFAMYQDLDSLHISLSKDEEMHLQGRIDRIDLYENENSVYVKVMDYKSGNSKFDLAALYYGLQLQLVLYMNVALDREKVRNKNKNIIPAGLFYYQVKDPIIKTGGEKKTQASIEQEILKELRLEGIANGREDCLNALDKTKNKESNVFKLTYKKDGALSANSAVMDEETVALMSSFVNQKIKMMGQEILAGKIAVNPYQLSEKSACTFCKYQSICKINSRLSGYLCRELEKRKEEEVIHLMKQKMEGDNEWK